MGAQVAVLSRGHGRRARRLVRVEGPPWPSFQEVGDEPLLLARRACPMSRCGWGQTGRPWRARPASAGATVALLDDGFQHRWLRRDGDVVVLDEAVGLGNGHLLPWGPLREPATSLKRASLLWLRAAAHPRALPTLPEGCPVVRARHSAVDVLHPDGTLAPLSSLAGRRLLGFCGIARPTAFGQTLREFGAEMVTVQGFPDHHAFTPKQLASASGRGGRGEGRARDD